MTVTLEELRALYEAGVALNTTGKERLRAAEQNAEVEADHRIAKAREATVALNEATEACLASQAEILDLTERLVDARERGSDARLVYETAWAIAYKRGVAGDRLPAGQFPDALIHRFQTATAGARSKW